MVGYYVPYVCVSNLASRIFPLFACFTKARKCDKNAPVWFPHPIIYAILSLVQEKVSINTLNTRRQSVTVFGFLIDQKHEVVHLGGSVRAWLGPAQPPI